MGLLCAFITQASARLCFATNKVVTNNHNLITAQA